MRLAKPLLCGLALLAACVAPHAVDAAVRPITFAIDSGEDYPLAPRDPAPPLALESVIQWRGAVRDDYDGNDTREDLPLSAQKNGTTGTDRTYTGLASDRSPWTGTLTAVYDDSTSTLQIVGGGNLFPKISGNYCPGFEPDEGANGGGPDDDDVNQCEEFTQDAQYGVILGTGSEGVKAASRDLLIDMQGQSLVTGTSIETVNWHMYWLRSNHDYDDVGAIDELFDTGTFSAPDPDSNEPVLNSPSIGHNEFSIDPILQDPEVTSDDDDFFTGTFQITGSTASIRVPVHVINFVPTDEADADGDGVVDDHIKLLAKGELLGNGDLGDPLTPGDANMDGKVDGLDVNIYSIHRNTGENHDHIENMLDGPIGHPHYGVWTTSDFNFDTIVNETDLAIIAANFGAGAGGGAGGHAVPEPSSLLLILLALVATACRRRIV